MVVDRATLFADGYFQGFAAADKMDYKSIINDQYYYTKRGPAEEQPALKQPIAYCIIIHKETGDVFAYQRAAKDTYTEERLRGKWSWGIGGHIDKIDAEGEDDPIIASLMRELDEEVYIDGHDTPRILGYINDDETPVGQVHFGLLFLIPTDSRNVKPRDAEIAWGGFKSVKELQEILESPEASVETWSEIGLAPLREYLDQNL